MQTQVIQPINGDPFVGMLETPVTSAPIVANYLSNLPAYRTGVSPLLRGVEIGLAHGYWLPGPFIKVQIALVSWLGPAANLSTSSSSKKAVINQGARVAQLQSMPVDISFRSLMYILRVLEQSSAVFISCP
jgi:hypothetical protein